MSLPEEKLDRSKKVVISGPVIELYEYRYTPKTTYINTNGRAGSGSEVSEERSKLYRGKTLAKARKNVRRLINANIDKWGEWPKFLTLTFAEHVTNVRQANYEFKKFRQRLEYALKIRLKYVGVVEFQQSGRIHYHVVIFNMPYIDANRLASIWQNGYIKINAIDHVDNVGAYITKYMTKDNDDSRLKGEKSYFASRGLYKPIERFIDHKQLTDFKRIFEHVKVYEAEFDNDYYGRIYYTQYNTKKRREQ